jgi:NNP family nitrate/nitrite transporter-like MFS transporter
MSPAPGTITRWEPENLEFWASTGSRIASNTLWITTGALLLSFSTWYMWSALVVKLQGIGFQLTDSQLFLLAAIPGLVGATLRIPYSFAIQLFGTRAVVTIATASLLVPSIGVGMVVQNPQTPFWVLLLLAGAAGLGGGNFSAFMSSTSLFYPKARQGTALGIQAGLGNFGVSLVQFLTPVVITASIFGAVAGPALTFKTGRAESQLYLQNAAFIWVVPVLFFTMAAAVGLKTLPIRSSLGQQSVIFRRKHNWIMTSLYVMTFGTFSGFSSAFAMLIKKIFGGLPGAPDPLHYAFLGALIGSATRPVAGWISDKIGGGTVTVFSGLVLLVASVGATFYTTPHSAADFPAFLAMMLAIFFAAGIGNGSTFRMIPIIFPPQEAGPVLGWTAAVGAYGSFIVPMIFDWSFKNYGNANAALLGCAAFYVVNIVLCWWYYCRKGAEVRC